MTEILHVTQTHSRVPGDVLSGKSWRTGMIARLCLWRKKRRTRRRLAELEAHILRDIGVTPGEAMREVRVSFPWHLSFSWRDDARPPDPWC